MSNIVETVGLFELGTFWHFLVAGNYYRDVWEVNWTVREETWRLDPQLSALPVAPPFIILQVLVRFLHRQKQE
jgi:hypothetical protein